MSFKREHLPSGVSLTRDPGILAMSFSSRAPSRCGEFRAIMVLSAVPASSALDTRVGQACPMAAAVFFK